MNQWNKIQDKFFGLYTEAKVYGDVSRYYIAVPTFVLVLINHVQSSSYSLLIDILIYTVSPLILLIIVHFHVKKIMPREMEYLSRKNPIQMEILDRLKKIEEVK